MLADGLGVDSVIQAKMHQCGLRGVTHIAALIDDRITAQQSGAQEGFLSGIGEIRLIGTDHAAKGVEFLDGHPILGQGSGLIGTDHAHAAQALNRLQFADNRIFFGHLLGAEGQHDGHDGTERLGNGGHSQRNGKQHGVQHDAAGQRGGTDQRDSENQAAEDQNTDRQLFTELVQADLKRSLLLLSAFEEGGDLTHLRVHAGGSDKEGASAIGHKAAGEHHVLPVSQRHIAADRFKLLVHGQALTGKGALCRFQAGTFQQAAIRADGIARLQKDHVAHGDLSARDLEHLSIPEHFCCWSGHLPQTVQ